MSFPFTRALPPIGATESDTLEFKRDVQPRDGAQSADRFELAKDVAAFANAAGGTILVGACGKSTVGQYAELEASRVAWITREYEEAVRDRCVPLPSLTTEQLAYRAGFVLAVHIAPFPSPVAVRLRGDKTDGWGNDAWVFFKRIASQNTAFRPEVLPMLMTPELRRTAILLRSIPKRAPVHVSRQRTPDPNMGNITNEHWIDDDGVDEMKNCVTFWRDEGPGKMRLRVPLDQIETVFPSQRDGEWHVDVRHYFEERSIDPEEYARGLQALNDMMKADLRDRGGRPI